MNLIVKTRGNQPIKERDRRWAESQFQKLSRLVPKEAVVEVVLEDLYGPKGGVDKLVHVLAELPHAKEPFHLEEKDMNFKKAITVARGRFERYIKKYRQRHIDSHRRPRKYWFNKLFERFSRKELGVEEPRDE